MVKVEITVPSGMSISEALRRAHDELGEGDPRELMISRLERQYQELEKLAAKAEERAPRPFDQREMFDRTRRVHHQVTDVPGLDICIDYS